MVETASAIGGTAPNGLAEFDTALATEIQDRADRRRAERESAARAQAEGQAREQLAQLDELIVSTDPIAAPFLVQAREALATKLRALDAVEATPAFANEGNETPESLVTANPTRVTDPVASDRGGTVGNDSIPSGPTRSADSRQATHSSMSMDEAEAGPAPFEDHGRASPSPKLGDDAVADAPEPSIAGDELFAEAEQTAPISTSSPCPADGALASDAVVSLVSQRRPLAAAWVVQAHEPDSLLARALGFNGAAHACGPGAISATDDDLGRHPPACRRPGSQPSRGSRCPHCGGPGRVDRWLGASAAAGRSAPSGASRQWSESP